MFHDFTGFVVDVHQDGGNGPVYLYILSHGSHDIERVTAVRLDVVFAVGDRVTFGIGPIPGSHYLASDRDGDHSADACQNRGGEVETVHGLGKILHREHLDE